MTSWRSSTILAIISCCNPNPLCTDTTLPCTEVPSNLLLDTFGVLRTRRRARNTNTNKQHLTPTLRSTSRIAPRIAMAGVQLGLEVAFYLYPCGLFVTLLVSQAIYYIRERRQENQASTTPPSADDKDADKTRQFYARLVWAFQFLLTLLLASPGLPETCPTATFH